MISGKVTIEALEFELPLNTVTSDQIEAEIEATMHRLGLPSGLLTSLTGIRERRVWHAGVTPSDAATLAARKVIEVSGIDPDEIGCIINTSVCKDYIEPSVACLVQGNLKLPAQCINFDIGNACLGFINAMHMLMLMIESRQIEYGLIVNAETSGDVLSATLERLKRPDVTIEEYRENFATLTLGSGAVAMILGHIDKSRTGHVINGMVSLSDTRYNRLCIGQNDFMKANALEIMNQGVKLACKTWKLAENSLPAWRDRSINLYIPHQVSEKNIRMLNNALEIDARKQHLNFMTLGNIGPAAVPITLKMAEDEGRARPGDHIALLGIGSGLNCSMVSITW